ncbi:MAG: helix-turn-helix transcriptional regulator [Acidimicrobiales bacterium]
MPSDPNVELAQSLGAEIRTRRLERGLTMAQLAEASELSQPFLSKVERGLGTLSMASLDRVARALGTSAVGLLGGPTAPTSIDIVRKSDRHRLPAYEGQAGFGEALTRRSGQLRVIEFDSGPVNFLDEPYVHRNDSVCVVISGSYEFEFDDTRVILTEGDSISASGGVRQRYRALEQPARLLLILVSEDAEVVRGDSAI